MWLVIVVILFAFVLFQSRFTVRDVYVPVTDEQAIQNIAASVGDSLQPVEVVSRTGDIMRVMFLDTKTYAGKLMDFDVTANTAVTTVHPKSLAHGIMPTKKTL